MRTLQLISTFLLFSVSSIIYSPILTAQETYTVDKQNEQKYILAGSSLLLLSAYQREKTTPPDLDFLSNLSSDNIPAFERDATLNHDQQADIYSDIGIYSSIGLPVALYLLPDIDKKQLTILWGETIILTAGGTLLTKYLSKRPRPYMYNTSILPSEKMDKNGLTSFFSGHTSITAANAFFAAKIFNDYYPDKAIKYLVWTLAATWPAFTGYMRVKSGNHFTTDVITGYAFGAAVGILIPQLHKNKKPSAAWNISGSSDGICLSYSLNN